MGSPQKSRWHLQAPQDRGTSRTWLWCAGAHLGRPRLYTDFFVRTNRPWEQVRAAGSARGRARHAGAGPCSTGGPGAMAALPACASRALGAGRPWLGPGLATAAPAQGAGGEAGTRPAAGGTPAAPPGPSHRGGARRRRHPLPTPNFDPRPPPYLGSPRPHRRGKERAQGGPVRPLAGGRTRCTPEQRAGRVRAGRARETPYGRGQVPAGGQRKESASQTGRPGPGRPLGGGSARPWRRLRPEARRQSRRLPGRRRAGARRSGAAAASARAAPAQLPLQCRTAGKGLANPREFRDPGQKYEAEMRSRKRIKGVQLLQTFIFLLKTNLKIGAWS